MPGLLASTFLTAFLLGPALSSWPAGKYLADPRPWRYVIQNSTLIRLFGTLPGVFACNPVPNVVNGFARHGDFSYGLYVYADPIQQTVLLLSPTILLWKLFVISYAAALACSVFSWHLIEKRALALKRKLPWRVAGRIVMQSNPAA